MKQLFSFLQTDRNSLSHFDKPVSTRLSALSLKQTRIRLEKMEKAVSKSKSHQSSYTHCGISDSQAPVTPIGFRWDLQWSVVNYKGRAYTQRVQLPNEAFLENWETVKALILC
ncbi:uncharacterized protein LOC133721055 [Rosa rugosa]|uniref:uncharacterized protein LOC133721055 n=1 Tax=Rosa rugosa TaxID=74645 RepID=UPI002B40D584|nr:uncharacterized protein LOC133721055 [Rosa rugosa]